MEVRGSVLKSLETARNEKLIGAPLEARVRLSANGDLYPLLEEYAGELPALFIVSQVELDARRRRPGRRSRARRWREVRALLEVHHRCRHGSRFAQDMRGVRRSRRDRLGLLNSSHGYAPEQRGPEVARRAFATPPHGDLRRSGRRVRAGPGEQVAGGNARGAVGDVRGDSTLFQHNSLAKFRRGLRPAFPRGRTLAHDSSGGLLAAALAVLAAVLWRPCSGVRERTALAIGLALILGGAAGNVYDRVMFGTVTDFLDVYVGEYHWFTFNVADSAITTGAALFLLDMWQTRHRGEPKAGSQS